jgi:hypothetical protein
MPRLGCEDGRRDKRQEDVIDKESVTTVPVINSAYRETQESD